MNKFSEFDIKPSLPNFIGDKIKMAKILNREITIHDYRITDSKFGDAKKCLQLQLSISDIKYVLFTGAIYLTEQILKVPKEKFPFTTTIIKDNERFEFS